MSGAADYRLDGVYRQRQEGFYMQRVKLPAGVISAPQALAVAAVAELYGQGTVHLTTRGSMEVHWLREEELPLVKRELAKAGLSSRGACGGAVRGITCGSQSHTAFSALESLARRLNRHFSGNPRFERLPKKFKIGIEATTAGGRHLIQDVGLVLAGNDDGNNLFDLWMAGGLGREPQAGFKFLTALPEERIIPVIEAILRVYAAHAPPPKRLKYLANKFGETELCRLIEAEAPFSEAVPPAAGLPEFIAPPQTGRKRLQLPVFAGKLTAVQLKLIADSASKYGEGVMMISPDQDLLLLIEESADSARLLEEICADTGLDTWRGATPLRVCPGSHECLMGLSATREIADRLLKSLGKAENPACWAVSGCPNSCSQPQLADYGIVSSSLVKGDDGERTPRFDLYRRSGSALGEAFCKGLTTEELFAKIEKGI